MADEKWINKIGKKFGKLTILDIVYERPAPGRYVTKAKCLCECGNTKLIQVTHLKQGAAKSCGCAKRLKVKPGDRFNYLVVLEYYPHHYLEDGTRIFAMVKCKCDCGNIKIYLVNNLKLGVTKSCGCYVIEFRSEISKAGQLKRSDYHGKSYDALYCLWKGINQRCYNPKSTGYKNYGGRGIINFWKNEPIEFINYINEYLGPSPDGHSLDRINNNGNYEPDNLRWATPQEQIKNKSFDRQREMEELAEQIHKISFENIQIIRDIQLLEQAVPGKDCDLI